MAILPAPAEFLQIADRHSVTFSVVNSFLGQCQIHTQVNGVETPKEIDCLRVFVGIEDKHPGVGYWDISSKRLIAMITPLLPSVKGTKKKLKITAYGVKPSTQFQVELI